MYLRGIQQATVIMRKTTLILAFLAAVWCSRAQDFLTPESYGIYDYYENGNETLFRLLVADENIESRSATWMARYTTYYLCAPSFSPEYALIVGKNQLILNKAKESVWHYITAVEHAQSKDFRKRDKEQQKQIQSRANSFNTNPVDRFTLHISEEQSQCIAELFEHATKTATHLQSLSLGYDGTTHYFNYSGQLASVWVPQGGRTARLTSIANRLCYAVEHQDTTVLKQQMELCRTLTKEFKQEYPNRYFLPSWVSRSTGDKGPWHCELSGDNCIWLDVLFDTTVTTENAQSTSSLYTDSLAAWSREIFLMSENPCYPSIVIDNHANNAVCMVKQNDRGFERELTMPETYWRREVILSAAQLPPGQHYFTKEAWRESKSSTVDMYQLASTNEYDDSDGTIVDWFCYPDYEGGFDSIKAHVQRNLHKPAGYEEWCGIVLVEITIETDGTLTNPKVIISLDPFLDAVAVKAIMSLPSKWIWRPERCSDGVIRRCFYRIPAYFSR